MKLNALLIHGLSVAACIACTTASPTKDSPSPQFVLGLYEDNECGSATDQVDISERPWHFFTHKPLPPGDIWKECVDFSQPFNSVKFKMTESSGSDYPMRSSKNCRADVFRGRNCQGPKLASWTSGFCQGEHTADLGQCHPNEGEVDQEDGWSMRGACSYMELNQNPGPENCIIGAAASV